MKRRYAIVAAVILLLALGAGLVASLPVASSSVPVPTTRPERGDVEVRVHARGEIAPHQSVSLTAPPVGGQLQIVQLVPSGTTVRPDDVVIVFDPEGQRHDLVQARSQLQEAEMEIVKLQADSRVRSAEDELALVQARFDVALGETRVTGNEFVGAIEARKNVLDLEAARRKLAQLEEDVRTHAASSEAAMTALVERRRKAQLAIELAERNLESLVVRAPVEGMVTINQNQGAMGNFGFRGMTIPDYREGDTVQPGSPIASVVDLSQVDVNAKLDESGRAALAEDAVAAVHVEAIPEVSLAARARVLGGMASQTFRWLPGAPEFDASFRVEEPLPQLRPGMTVHLRANAEPVKDALHVPRQALFHKEGRQLVYIRRGSSFVATEVKVLRLTESRAVLEGIEATDEVALADPERSAASPPGESTGPLVSPGGR